MRPRVPVEDKLDIMEAVARYAWALDTGDLDGYTDCFTEDGWIEHHPPGRMQGRQGIRELTDFLWYSRPNHYLGRQHRMNQFIMTPEGGDVRIKCFWSILQHKVDTGEEIVFGLGTWDTVATRCADGEWRFKSVYVDIWRGQDVPWVGDERAFGQTEAKAVAS
jgi:hypothetical protein